jgi:hypothetical protein
MLVYLHCELVPVRAHVFLTVHGGFEGFLAVGTHEGPHLAVGTHVTLQAPVGGERLLTDDTLVGLEARVGADVGLEDPARHERSHAL